MRRLPPRSCCVAFPSSPPRRSSRRVIHAKGCSRNGSAPSPRSRSRRRLHRDLGNVRTRAGVRLRRVRARGPARVPRRRERPRTSTGAGQGSGHRSLDARRRAPRRGNARAARLPPRRGGHARVVRRARGTVERACRIRPSCCSSTNPRWSRGAVAMRRSIASRQSTCCRARSPRSTASPVCTSAVTATSASRSRPVRKCSVSR